ncbi:ATP-dependent Clp protease adapter ClpS [Arcanobacterium haemolyticum]|nr:ATP-dependent Clp protease adapter ClpS [Arcanobacterium haemolyticum]
MARVSTQPAADAHAQAQAVRGWRTVVHNDPVNLMTYVEWVFQSYFGFSQERAHSLMLAVHEQGRAVLSHGQREQMEADAQAMHTYGLWATIEEEPA